MKFKQLYILRCTLDKKDTLSPKEEALLLELKELEKLGLLKNIHELFESLAVAQSSCSCCGRPY